MTDIEICTSFVINGKTERQCLVMIYNAFVKFLSNT